MHKSKIRIGVAGIQFISDYQRLDIRVGKDVINDRPTATCDTMRFLRCKKFQLNYSRI